MDNKGLRDVFLRSPPWRPCRTGIPINRLQPRTRDYTPDGDRVTLMTLHSSKEPVGLRGLSEDVGERGQILARLRRIAVPM